MDQNTGISIFDSADELTKPVSRVCLKQLPKNIIERCEKYNKEKFLHSLQLKVEEINSHLKKLEFSEDPIDIGDGLMYLGKIKAVFSQPVKCGMVKQLEEHCFSFNSKRSRSANKAESSMLNTCHNKINFPNVNGDTGIDGFHFQVCPVENEIEVLKRMIEKQVGPAGFDGCIEFYERYKNYISFDSNSAKLDNNQAENDFLNNTITTLDEKTYQVLMEEVKQGAIPQDIDFSEKVIDFLLKSDTRRAQFTPYEKALLTEHTQGHWDLADTEAAGEIRIELPSPVFARNPYRDIQSGSTIGIDFGTKSTIVSLKDRKGKPIPVAVGGKFSEPKPTDYENPTILHLCDFESFITQYQAKAGRPETLWETLTVSHAAKEELDNANDANYYSFITSPKQWAAQDDEKLMLTDNTGETITIPPYLQCTEHDFDPIEVYAYYIGLAINNMKRNAIYTNYLLSFPVTYKKAVRDKIRESFTRGLIKSLPNVMAKDESFIRRKFRVDSGTSEPAAYAVCALKSYGFDPKDESEVHYYGIFDFGGGTTDFNFGLWRAGSGEEEEDINYVIEHFGAGGERFLGGENILGDLAFSIFSAPENQNKLREKRICFTWPLGESPKFPGYESLINQNSKWANLNMHKMKEALRPLWEKTSDYENKYPENTVPNLILFNNGGQTVSDLGIIADIEKLDAEIEERIRRGIKNFLTNLIRAMSGRREPKPRKINIFLAGNSCKAEVVKKIFDEECNDFQNLYLQKLQEKHNQKSEEKLFEIFPPLGTEDSYKKMEELGIYVQPDDIYLPTGKTGVAIGLVLSSPGSGISVKNANIDKSGEIGFSFVVGIDKRNKFAPIINFETPLCGDWTRFKRVYEDNTIIFYYTSSASGMTGDLDIDETEREILHLEESKPGAYVFIRPVSPTEIEYKVSVKVDDEGLFPVEKIKFEEGR